MSTHVIWLDDENAHTRTQNFQTFAQKKEREKRNESQSRGERQKRTKSVAVLAFFLPTVLRVFVLLVTNSLEEFSPSLWLLLFVFLKRKISPFFLCFASQKKNHPHKFTLYIFLFTHENDIIRTKMALTLTASTVVASVKPTVSSNRRCVDVVCARISRR